MEDDGPAKEELYKIIRRAVFSKNVTIFEEEHEIKDSPSLDYIVMVSAPETREALKKTLDEFYRGRRYQNTLIFITQDGPDILSEHEYINKAKRIASASSLMSRIDDPEGDLKSLIRNERKDLANSLRNRFGRLIRWKGEEDTDQLRLRQIPVQPSVADVRDKIGTDRSYIADHILSEIRKTEGGRRVESLLNDFRRFRRLPVLLEDEVFYGAIRNLYQDKRIIIEGDRAKMFVPGQHAAPKQITDDLTLHHPTYIPDHIINPPQQGQEEEDEKEIIDLGFEVDGETTIDRKVVVEHIPIEGNSPRSVLSMMEARINQEKDRVRRIKVVFEFKEKLTKEKALDFIEELPPSDHYEVDIEVERDKTDD
jgi:hypothetical protein